jgi:UDP-N-acetylmuramate dehydrogenase
VLHLPFKRLVQKSKFKLKKCFIKNLTWLGVGGQASLFKPEDVKDVCDFVKYNEYVVIGAGSNIVGPEILTKPLVRLGRAFNYITIEGQKITAGAATLDAYVAKFAMENSLSGLEFLSVIPGTVGGAVAMNAGAYGAEISDLLVCIKAVNKFGEVIEISSKEIDFSYRSANLPKDLIIIGATFFVKESNSKEIKSKMISLLKLKQDSQPIQTKTCGSIFKNPPNQKAWQLIDQAGFRGFCIGGAQISEKHCNFLINNGNATSQDIQDLCFAVRDGVKSKLGIEMEFELVIL